MPRTRPLRVALGPWVYEVDADAVRGYRPGGVYRVGRIRRVGGDGPRYMEQQERRVVTNEAERVRVIAAVVRREREAEEQKRNPPPVVPPSARQLVRARYGVVRPPKRPDGDEPAGKEG